MRVGRTDTNGCLNTVKEAWLTGHSSEAGDVGSGRTATNAGAEGGKASARTETGIERGTRVWFSVVQTCWCSNPLLRRKFEQGIFLLPTFNLPELFRLFELFRRFEVHADRSVRATRTCDTKIYGAA